jgi:hypothetical protein
MFAGAPCAANRRFFVFLRRSNGCLALRAGFVRKRTDEPCHAPLSFLLLAMALPGMRRKPAKALPLRVHRPASAHFTRGAAMSIGTILLIVVVLMLVGALPTWPHARNWGYGPSGILGVILIIVLILFLMGRL